MRPDRKCCSVLRVPTCWHEISPQVAKGMFSF
nr:MAG TPA: hypothetical protein [Bacteriophage sp.]